MKTATMAAACLLLVGCAGGPQGLNVIDANLTGIWKIKLSNDQAGRFVSVPPGSVTEIAVEVKQDAMGSLVGVPHPFGSFSTSAEGFDAACGTVGGSSWWNAGSWNPAFNLNSGGNFVGGKVTMTFTEASFIEPTSQVTLRGLLNPDGTLSGSYTDTCTPPATFPTNEILGRVLARAGADWGRRARCDGSRRRTHKGFPESD